MNKAFIMGRLVRDPEVKTTPAGELVASFSVVTSKKWKDQSGTMQEKAEFHNIVAWKKIADTIGRFCKKGKRVMVEGEIQTRDWQGQDGVKKYRTEIIARNINIIDFPPKEDNQEQQEEQSENKPENIPF